MSAKDIYHEHVRNALVKDGWKITHDPLWLKWNRKDAYIDLGAERIIIAEKATRKIAVEVKSFVSASEMRDLCEAVGQFVLYRRALAKNEPRRELFLAVREEVYLRLFTDPDGQELCATEGLKLIVFDEDTQEIVQWIP